MAEFSGNPIHDAGVLLDRFKKDAKSSYAQHRAAEVECWEAQKRSGSDYPIKIVMAIRDLYDGKTTLPTA